VKVTVDPDVCQRHGLCSILAPGVFTLRDDLELEYVEEPDPEFRGEVEEAARACPTQAIRLRDDDG
jgi:ferredoxin